MQYSQNEDEPEPLEPREREPHYCFFTDEELGQMYREIQRITKRI